MGSVTDLLPGFAAWRDLALSGAVLVAAIVIGLVGHGLLFAVLGRVTGRLSRPWPRRALDYARNPARLVLPLFVIGVVVPGLALPARALGILGHVTDLLFIAAVAYLFTAGIRLLRDFLLARHDVASEDNLLARRVYTQVHVLEKVLYSIVAVAAVSFMLMTFDGARQIGVSILASAGIAGIILGLAAQTTIGTLLAGVQIAITQPIRLDDVVIVEGEWGWIEEITLTYVVVRIWDQRRLVLPITYFIETPFENWTRSSAQILGTVFLYTDYTVSVDAIREQMQRVLEDAEQWDGRVATVQVTDSRPDTLEVRLLVSASDSGKAWDLRCLLREKMVAYLHEHHPGSLPRFRAELEPLPA